MILLALAACSSAQEPAAAPAPPVAPSAGTAAPAPAPAVASALPDLRQGLATNLCEQGPGNEGATSYFTSTLTVDGNAVRGTEEWLIYANSKLKASPRWSHADSCVVVWNVTGRTAAPRHCADCDLGILATARLDEAQSTCPAALTRGDATMELSYDVRRAPDGTAHWSFSASGKPLGQGFHRGNQVSYISDSSCRWF